jgi:putative tricarboxylic transport membrane protein
MAGRVKRVTRVMRVQRLRWAAAVAALLLAVGPAMAQVARCIAPAKPGGGFDLTCQLLREALPPAMAPLPIRYQPGGIGALVFDEVARDVRPASPEGAELVAFSSGTLLNLAQGRFGRQGVEAVQWVAALAVDHGVVVVHRDAPWHDLPALLETLKAQPASIAFAAGGTIGSQDWMKAALLARAAGVGPRAVRLVAFEGGGDAMQALAGRHVQVLTGDAAEVVQQLQRGAPLRVLAVLSAARLPGPLAQVPTAREQGVDVQWPILRGVYTSVRTAPEVVAEITRSLSAMQARGDYRARLERLGLQPVEPGVLGPSLSAHVRAEVERHRRQAIDIGLVRAVTP